jgi:phage terminase small subunit
LEGSLNLPINGSLSHIGILGKKVGQIFGGLLECGKRGVNQMHYEAHMNPETEQESQAREDTEKMVNEYGFKPN